MKNVMKRLVALGLAFSMFTSQIFVQSVFAEEVIPDEIVVQAEEGEFASEDIISEQTELLQNEEEIVTPDSEMDDSIAEDVDEIILGDDAPAVDVNVSPDVIVSKETETETKILADDMLLVSIIKEMQSVLEKVGISAGMTEEQFTEAVLNMEDESILQQMSFIEEQGSMISEELANSLSAEQITVVETYAQFVQTFDLLNEPSTIANYNLIEGVISASVSGASSDKWENSELKVTAKGSKFLWKYNSSTATITLKNESTKVGIISFDWTASNVN